MLASAQSFCRDHSSMEQVRALLHSANDRNHTGFDETDWQDAVDLGWQGLALPEIYDGSNFGIGAAVSIAEAMGQHLMSTPFFSCTLATQAILRNGTEQQKELWLPKISAGAIVTLALLDNEDWSAPQPDSYATLKGENWQLNGGKFLVSDASAADAFVVSTLTPQGESALVIVRRDQLAAEAIQPHVLLDETKRAAKVDFTGVMVDSASILQREGVEACLRDILLIGAMLTAAEAVGTVSACLNTTVEYLKTRKQFGKLIGSNQALKHPMVEILGEFDSAKSLVYHAATLVNEQPLNRDAEIACRMAKVKACEALLFAGDRGIQFHGAMGFTYECDAQLYLRRAQWSQQQFGDANLHRKQLASLLLD